MNNNVQDVLQWLVQNPITQATSILFGLIGLLLTGYAYLRSRQYRKLFYGDFEVALSAPAEGPLPPVTLNIEGQTTTSVVETFVLLRNRGSVPIEKSEFLSEFQLSLRWAPDGDQKIYAAKILASDCHPKGLELIFHDASVELTFEILRPGESILLGVSHSFNGSTFNLQMDTKNHIALRRSTGFVPMTWLFATPIGFALFMAVAWLDLVFVRPPPDYSVGLALIIFFGSLLTIAAVSYIFGRLILRRLYPAPVASRFRDMLLARLQSRQRITFNGVKW